MTEASTPPGQGEAERAAERRTATGSASEPGGGGAIPTPTAAAGMPEKPNQSQGDGVSAPGTAPGTPAAVEAPPAPNLPPKERARRLYTTTACRTLEEAAEAVGVGKRAVEEWSRTEGWAAERAAWIEADRKRSYAEASEAEARAQGNARRHAWRCVSIAVERLADQLAAGQKVTPYEGEALARMALALSGVGDPAADEDAARLHRLPLPDLLGKLRDVFAGYGSAGRLDSGGALDALDGMAAKVAPPQVAANGSAGNGKAHPPAP